MNLNFIKKVFRVFSGDLSKEYTIQEIANASKMPYFAAHRTTMYLSKIGCLKIRKIGPISQVSINKNPLSYSYIAFTFADTSKTPEQILHSVDKLWQSIK